MNNLLDTMQQRRSVAPQAMAEPGPDGAQVDALLRIASRVPDHGKLAPWRFLVIEGEARHRLGDALGAIAAADDPGLSPERIAAERGRLARAPLVVGVVSRARPHAKIPEWEQVLSAGAVCMNLVVAANAMGFRTAWLTEWIAYDRRALDLFGLSSDERMAGFVHIGTAAETVPDRPRPALADIVSRL